MVGQLWRIAGLRGSPREGPECAPKPTFHCEGERGFTARSARPGSRAAPDRPAFMGCCRGSPCCSPLVAAQSVAVVPYERLNGRSRDDGRALRGRPRRRSLMGGRSAVTNVMNVAMGMARCAQGVRRNGLRQARKRDREGQRQNRGRAHFAHLCINEA